MPEHEYHLLQIDPRNPLPGQFDRIADVLLNQTALLIGGRPHCILEIEFYLHGPYHPDPFTHGHPAQQQRARWYFHRMNNGFRGGSFKGVDISLGGGGDYGGILLRSMAEQGSSLINGSSLCVDRMLQLTQTARVGDLDAAIGNRPVWDSHSPLFIRYHKHQTLEILATSRVGLTLKRLQQHPHMPDYLARPYRYTVMPSLSKGKQHTVIALYRLGLHGMDIAAKTATRIHTVQSYIDAFLKGHSMAVENFAGKSLNRLDTCKLLGCLVAQVNGLVG